MNHINIDGVEYVRTRLGLQTPTQAKLKFTAVQLGGGYLAEVLEDFNHVIKLYLTTPLDILNENKGRFHNWKHIKQIILVIDKDTNMEEISAYAETLHGLFPYGQEIYYSSLPKGLAKKYPKFDGVLNSNIYFKCGWLETIPPDWKISNDFIFEMNTIEEDVSNTVRIEPMFETLPDDERTIVNLGFGHYAELSENDPHTVKVCTSTPINLFENRNRLNWQHIRNLHITIDTEIDAATLDKFIKAARSLFLYIEKVTIKPSEIDFIGDFDISADVCLAWEGDIPSSWNVHLSAQNELTFDQILQLPVEQFTDVFALYVSTPFEKWDRSKDKITQLRNRFKEFKGKQRIFVVDGETNLHGFRKELSRKIAKRILLYDRDELYSYLEGNSALSIKLFFKILSANGRY